MAYSCRSDFFTDLSKSDPGELVRGWLDVNVPHAFQSSNEYEGFLQRIRSDWPESQAIQVAGTSNWRYSLNPRKSFSEYHGKSDVDVVIVSPIYFERTWDVLRVLHRKHWYGLPTL